MASAVYTYSVAPFENVDPDAQDRAWGRVRKLATDEQNRFMDCGICGRPVDWIKARGWGHPIEGGAIWGGAELTSDSGDMAFFPIGPDCHRQFKLAMVGDITPG